MISDKIIHIKHTADSNCYLYMNKIQGILVLDICEFIELTCQEFATFKTDFYMMFLFESAQGVFTVAGKSVTVKEKSILLIAPNKVSAFHNSKDYNGKVLIFTDAIFVDQTPRVNFLCELQADFTTQSQPKSFLKNRYEQVSCLFKMIQIELQNPYSSIQKEILSNYLFNILLFEHRTLKHTLSLFTSDLHLVKSFKKQVYKQHNKNQSIKYYAATLNVSLTTLENAFKKHEFKTPKKWLTELIIMEIKQKLVLNELTTKELALQYGYYEVTNFIKFFKKHTGLTPKAFKLQHYSN